MPITEKQREVRKKYLGSTDIAAVLGVDKYRTAYDVWLEKTGKAERGNNENEIMYAGTVFEDGVLKYAETQLGELIHNTEEEPLEYIDTEFGLIDHPDALVKEGGNPVEAKTSGLFGPLPEGWGEIGTDSIPDSYLIQGHVHMICTQKELCHLAAFLGGRGFGLYHIDRDKEIVNIIMEKAHEFWSVFVKTDTPPPDVLPSLEWIKRIKREPDKVIDIPEAMVTNLLNAKESLKIATEIKDDAQAELLAALGDAEAGNCVLGMYTYMESKTKQVDLTKLRAEKPEIAAEYTTVSAHRTLRFKKPKAGKYGG